MKDNNQETQIKISKEVFNDSFYPLLFNYENRWEVYKGGSGSGKSHFIAQKLVIKALNDPGRRIVICRRYGSTINQTVWQNFIQTLMFFQVYDRCDINKTERVINLPNKSQLIFLGLDDEYKLLSLTGIADFFIEEVFEVSEDVVNQINLRLRGNHKKNKQIIMAFNPVSKASWLFSFLNDEDKRPKSLILHESNYKCNKFLDQEYIDQLLELKRTNPHNYRIYVLNEWGVPMEGLVFPNHKVENFDIDELAKDTKLQLRIGADFGWIDSSTVIMSLWDKENKKIYVIKEFCKSRATLEEIARAIERMNCGKTPIYCDSSDPRSIDWLQTQGINAKKSHKHNGSNELYIQFLQNHEIICHESCVHMAEDLENFSYAKDKNGQYVDGKYTHEFSHCIDGLKYSYSDVYRNKRLKSFRWDLGI